MRGHIPIGLVLATVATFGPGCDACRGSRVEAVIRWEGTENPATGTELHAFWFDLDEDGPFEGSVEERVRVTGEKRWHRASYGISQKDWKTAVADSDGRARFRLETFYAGALFLPIHDLILGARENDPTGLWIVVRTGVGTEDRPQEFVVIERDGIPVPVRVDRSRECVCPGESAGSIEVGTPDDGFGAEWRLVLRLRPPEPR